MRGNPLENHFKILSALEPLLERVEEVFSKFINLFEEQQTNSQDGKYLKLWVNTCSSCLCRILAIFEIN